MDSRPGLYDSVLVLDYKSLYPSIIRTFLIDPVGLVEGMRHPSDADSVPGFRNARFSRSKHCLPAIVEQIWQGREAAKRQHNKPLSQALKIIMNALYGVLGSSGCRFFDPRLASSITLRGHEIMRQTRELIEAEGYQVIYGDTDSTFVWLKQPHDEQQAAQIGRALVQRVNARWQQHLQQQFGLENALELEFETHYSRFLMPTIRGAEQGSKKRYAGLIVRAGGEEEMVYKGSKRCAPTGRAAGAAVPAAALSTHLQTAALPDYVRDYVGKTLSGDFDDQLVYRKRLRRKLDDYQRNVPPHARAARIADDYNRSQAAAAVSERRLDQLRDDRRRAGTAGNAPFAHRLSALPRTPAATGGRRYTPFLARRFHHAGHRADGAVLRLRQLRKIIRFCR